MVLSTLLDHERKLCVMHYKFTPNYEQDNTIVENSQPVKGIDPSHTWTLTTTYYMTADIPKGMADARRLQVLSGNPVTGESANILGDYLVSAGERKYIAFAAPTVQDKFYAAIVDSNRCYTMVAFTPNERTIDFSQPLATRVQISDHLLGYQTFSYCYEDEMPEPGDYDYNDVVLRISQERTSTNQIMLNVTLAAVGSLSQIAAALRIVNYSYDEIESVTTIDGETFNDEYKKSTLPYIDSDELLIRGNNDEAVINLFEDAHWATGSAFYASEGYIPRYKYNVSKSTSEELEMVPPRTISYVITFKNSKQLDYFTLDMLDPFIIVAYNGAFMEVHAVYQYKSSTILHEYVQPSSAVILPWALVIPSGLFRYPLDGVNIGYAKDDALFGAYLTEGHSFGQWAASHTASQDWYNYPTGNMVY